MPDVGLLVVDDEANRPPRSSAPRYNARDVAVHRAVTERAACLLVGSVPSAEAAAALMINRGPAQLRSPGPPDQPAHDRSGGTRTGGERAGGRSSRPGRRAGAAPLVEVVDPDDEGRRGRACTRAGYMVRDALARGESAYVLVPRRGGR